VKLTSSLLLVMTIALVTTAALVRRHPLTVESTATVESGPVRMIRFVLSTDGIYPRRMQVDQGLLNIAVQAETAASQGLVIESVNGDQRTRLTQVNRSDNNRRGRSVLRLTSGRYLVSDASQPTHSAELIVNP
jgi:hypothetical protein